MDNELLIYPEETHVYVEDETPQLHIEPEPNAVFLDEMENAYRYELWRCWQLLQQIKTQTDLLEQSLETITPDDVKSMWGV